MSRRQRTLVIALVASIAVYWAVRAGDLEPTDPPAPTMVTLAELDGKLDSIVAAASHRRFIGVTAGSLVGGAGWMSMSGLCEAEFGTTARMCTSEEILATPVGDWPTLPDDAWVQPKIVAGGSSVFDISGIGAGVNEINCSAWSATSTGSGLVLRSPGWFNVRACNTMQRIACCQP